MISTAEDYKVVEGVEIDRLKPLPRHVLVRWFRKPETKAGILIPQNRQRAGFMKGQLLAVGSDCDPALKAGMLIEFNGLGDKLFVGVQDPDDRDTVFGTRYENVYGIVGSHDGDSSTLDMVGSWILVTPDVIPEKRESGLLLPGQARETELRHRRGLTGIVDSAGGMQSACVAGDHIVFNAANATRIRIGDHNDAIKLVISGDDEDGDVLGFVENGEESL